MASLSHSGLQIEMAISHGYRVNCGTALAQCQPSSSGRDFGSSSFGNSTVSLSKLVQKRRQGLCSTGYLRDAWGCSPVTAVLRDGERRPEGSGDSDDLHQSGWIDEVIRPENAFISVVSGPPAGQLNVSARVIYSLILYGGMALVGKLICDIAGVDYWGGFKLDAEDFFGSILYALLPIFGTLVLHQDLVVEEWAPARALRDAEDEELSEFFVGMKPWQYTLIAGVASLAEELFFRSAVQGGLAHALQVSSRGISDTTYGISALTGVITTFSPCAQAAAAVLTAAISGSMFYAISSPLDPKLVVSRGYNKREMRKSAEAWHERQKLKKIYSPLLESLVSLYLGFEWLLTGNLMAPMITHALYYCFTVRTGVCRIEERRLAATNAVMKARPPCK